MTSQVGGCIELLYQESHDFFAARGGSTINSTFALQKKHLLEFSSCLLMQFQHDSCLQGRNDVSTTPA